MNDGVVVCSCRGRLRFGNDADGRIVVWCAASPRWGGLRFGNDAGDGHSRRRRGPPSPGDLKRQVDGVVHGYKIVHVGPFGEDGGEGVHGDDAAVVRLSAIESFQRCEGQSVERNAVDDLVVVSPFRSDRIDLSVLLNPLFLVLGALFFRTGSGRP